MPIPRPYSCFHLLFCGVGIILVGFLVYILCKKCYKIPYVPFYGCGLVLALGELYKQLFLYQIVNQGRYDWWYFPMQLCSTPMYLCIILIFMHKSSPITRTICTYLQDFSLLGGIMALAEPSGLMQPYVTLTVHGLTWHLILIRSVFTATGAVLPEKAGRNTQKHCHCWQCFSHSLLLLMSPPMDRQTCSISRHSIR